MSEAFRFARGARQPRYVAATTIAVIAVLVLIFHFEAHPLLAAFAILAVVPALWDILKDKQSTLTIGPSKIEWQTGARGGSVRLDAIERVKARTALDFSQRVTIHDASGGRHHIPAPCIPPGRSLDAELAGRGVTVERTLF